MRSRARLSFMRAALSSRIWFLRNLMMVGVIWPFVRLWRSRHRFLLKRCLNVLGGNHLRLIKLFRACILAAGDACMRLGRHRRIYERWRTGLVSVILILNSVIRWVHLESGFCSGRLVLLQRVGVSLVVVATALLLLRLRLLWLPLGSCVWRKLEGSGCIEYLSCSWMWTLLSGSVLRNSCENTCLVEVGALLRGSLG